MAERLLHGDGAERAPADTENDKVFTAQTNVRRDRFDFLNDVRLVVRKLAPTHGSAVCLDRFRRCGELARKRVELRVGNAAVAELERHHIVVVDLEAHIGLKSRIFIAFHSISSSCCTDIVTCRHTHKCWGDETA